MLRKVVNYPVIFVSRVILRFSKEKTQTTILAVDAAIMFALQLINFELCKLSKLVVHDSRVPIPLPNRWTNDDRSKSKQSKHLVLMQLKDSVLVPPTSWKSKEIENSEDKSWAAFNLMQSFNLIRREEFQTITTVRNLFQPSKDITYNILKEIYVGESVVNGENPYLVRKFNAENIKYDFTESKSIEEKYRVQIRNAFRRETYDQAVLEKAGLTKQRLVDAVSSGKNVYSVMFQHLQKLSKGQPLWHAPQMYMENETLNTKYVIQASYPIFMNIQKNGASGFICIGIAFRYNQGAQYSVFSPFFANQPYKCWKLAQAQLLQATLNDFNVRVHLGVLHLTTNQYNVPIYNSLTLTKPKGNGTSQKYQNFKNFIDFAYTMFNQGLEGVNVNAVSTLINPIAEYSIVNKVFNFSQADACSLIANYSNNINLLQFNPKSMIAKNGFTKDQASTFSQIKLDLMLTEILADYVKDVYQIYEVKNVSETLLTQIQGQNAAMTIGDGPNNRAVPKNQQQLLKLFQNLAFAWVCFHAHTWTLVPFGYYYSFRPSMLQKQVPRTPEEWRAIQSGSQLPHPKVLMSSSQLSGAVSIKDPNNFIIDKLKKTMFKISYAAFKALDGKVKEKYEKMESALNKTIQRLNAFGQQVSQINEKRASLKQPILSWMDPAHMECSLNI